MISEVFESLRAKLATDKQILNIFRQRKLEHYDINIKHDLVSEYIDDGWAINKKLKIKTKLRKDKPIDVFFKDSVWKLFAEIGFKTLNSDIPLLLPYTSNELLNEEIDVFAADDEVAVLIKCIASTTGPKESNFKKTIESLEENKKELISSTRKLLGNNNIKVVFIVATHDYYLCKPDKKRLDESNLYYIDNDTFTYYKDLLKHLGTAARYQLEANLFPGLKIPSIDSRVPAIRGKMGGHTYYSFMVEPDKLLKIGYILHRSKANKNLMPTYQRLIKKSRLINIRKFIENGGYFPNSIIANIDSNRAPKFELAGNQIDGTECRLGVLHLPKKYRSLFIIDGQHRLYGYSDTVYASSNAVPVVAFLNLDRSEQVRLFMEINENQKQVPKNLRHTLNADLQWDSDKLIERINALKLQIAQDLGEVLSSPLYDRILVGENARTNTRTITLDAIKQGLDRSNFFGVIANNSIKIPGTFFNDSNDSSYATLFPFLVQMFSYVENICKSEWNKPAKEGGLLLLNVGINSLLRIFSDIVDHLVSLDAINLDSDEPEDIAKKCSVFIAPLNNYFLNLDDTERSKIRKSYGSGGPTKYWRILQKVISEEISDFKPDGFDHYWEAESKAYNTQSFEMIRDIEEYLNNDFKSKLELYHGQAWFKIGVPEKVYNDSSALAASKNKKILNPKEEKTPWDCLHIIDYRSIALQPGNWKDIFEQDYTRPCEKKIAGGAKAKTNWMDKLNRIRNDTDHEYSVKQEEFELLQDIHQWLIKPAE